MIPTHSGTDNGCLPSCIASILELPVSAVPTIDFSLGKRWAKPYRAALLAATGYTLRVNSVNAKPRGYYIGYFYGRGTDAHVMVMNKGKIAFDPAYDWSGYTMDNLTQV